VFVQMELTPEIANYVIHFHSNLMTDAESKARAHLVATMKATKGRSDEQAQHQARSHPGSPTGSPQTRLFSNWQKTAIRTLNYKQRPAFYETPPKRSPSTFVQHAANWHALPPRNNVVTANTIGTRD